MERPASAFGVCLCEDLDCDGQPKDCAKDCEERRMKKQWKRYRMATKEHKKIEV